MKYIIEHLEPRVYKWCMIEYKHISKIAGKENLLFANVKTKRQRKELSKLGKIYKESVRDLMQGILKHKRVCLMDANAKKILVPEDARRFDFLVFGGILGDEPPRGRTMEELGKLGLAARNLGKKQMPTDSAVYAAKKIMSGKRIEQLDFVDGIEIKIRDGESVMLPFRYIVENSKPLLPYGLLEHLRKRKGF